MYSTARELGRIVRIHSTFFTILALSLFAVGVSIATIDRAPLPAPATKPQVSKAATDSCSADRAKKLEAYRADMAAGLAWRASNHIRYCATQTKDEELLRLTKEAERSDANKTVRNTSATTADRIKAAERLVAWGGPGLDEVVLLQKKLEVQLQREEKAQAKLVAQRKKSEGVRVGMSEEDVLASSWGKPERINRTVNQYGHSEQWVYGSGSYLYFKNGTLETVSTSR